MAPNLSHGLVIVFKGREGYLLNNFGIVYPVLRLFNYGASLRPKI